MRRKTALPKIDIDFNKLINLPDKQFYNIELEKIKVCLDSNPFAWLYIWNSNISNKCSNDLS